MKPFTIMPQNFIREEELKNRIAALSCFALERTTQRSKRL